LARDFEFCLFPETQRLLHPPAFWWSKFAQGYPVLTITFLTLIPNAIAALLNIAYNYDAIIRPMENAEGIFRTFIAIINTVFFSTGLLIGGLRVNRVCYYIWNAKARAELTDEQCCNVRILSTRLGHEIAVLGISLWTLSGFVWPITMHFALGAGDIAMYRQFISSLILCGMIAAIYPFFLITLLSLHRFYPLLVRLGTMGDRDRRALEKLRWWTWFYFGFAAFVPLFAGGMLAFNKGDALQWASVGSSVIGIAGVFAAWFAVRRIEQDLDSLDIVTRMESVR
jgi:hypothetical protein